MYPETSREQHRHHTRDHLRPCQLLTGHALVAAARQQAEADGTDEAAGAARATQGYTYRMQNTSLNRGIALTVGGLAIVGMGFTVGCSAKQAPSPTEQTQGPIESKRSNQNGPGANAPGSKAPNSFKPSKSAKPAPTAKPGDN